MREIWNRLTGKQYFRPLIIFMIILLFNGIVSKGEFFYTFHCGWALIRTYY